ncbi:hypothetical protein ADUPG1_008084, partial [Aduncisulcus paluster]
MSSHRVADTILQENLFPGQTTCSIFSRRRQKLMVFWSSSTITPKKANVTSFTGISSHDTSSNTLTSPHNLSIADLESISDKSMRTFPIPFPIYHAVEWGKGILCYSSQASIQRGPSTQSIVIPALVFISFNSGHSMNIKLITEFNCPSSSTVSEIARGLGFISSGDSVTVDVDEYDPHYVTFYRHSLRYKEELRKETLARETAASDGTVAVHGPDGKSESAFMAYSRQLFMNRDGKSSTDSAAVQEAASDEPSLDMKPPLFAHQLSHLLMSIPCSLISMHTVTVPLTRDRREQRESEQTRVANLKSRSETAKTRSLSDISQFLAHQAIEFKAQRSMRVDVRDSIKEVITGSSSDQIDFSSSHGADLSSGMDEYGANPRMSHMSSSTAGPDDALMNLASSLYEKELWCVCENMIYVVGDDLTLKAVINIKDLIHSSSALPGIIVPNTKITAGCVGMGEEQEVKKKNPPGMVSVGLGPGGVVSKTLRRRSSLGVRSSNYSSDNTDPRRMESSDGYTAGDQRADHKVIVMTHRHFIIATTLTTHVYVCQTYPRVSPVMNITAVFCDKERMRKELAAGGIKNVPRSSSSKSKSIIHDQALVSGGMYISPFFIPSHPLAHSLTPMNMPPSLIAAMSLNTCPISSLCMGDGACGSLVVDTFLQCHPKLRSSLYQLAEEEREKIRKMQEEEESILFGTTTDTHSGAKNRSHSLGSEDHGSEKASIEEEISEGRTKELSREREQAVQELEEKRRSEQMKQEEMARHSLADDKSLLSADKSSSFSHDDLGLSVIPSSSFPPSMRPNGIISTAPSDPLLVPLSTSSPSSSLPPIPGAKDALPVAPSHSTLLAGVRGVVCVGFTDGCVCLCKFVKKMIVGIGGVGIGVGIDEIWARLREDNEDTGESSQSDYIIPSGPSNFVSSVSVESSELSHLLKTSPLRYFLHKLITPHVNDIHVESKDGKDLTVSSENLFPTNPMDASGLNVGSLAPKPPPHSTSSLPTTQLTSPPTCMSSSFSIPQFSFFSPILSCSLSSSLMLVINDVHNTRVVDIGPGKGVASNEVIFCSGLCESNSIQSALIHKDDISEDLSGFEYAYSDADLCKSVIRSSAWGKRSGFSSVSILQPMKFPLPAHTYFMTSSLLFVAHNNTETIARFSGRSSLASSVHEHRLESGGMFENLPQGRVSFVSLHPSSSSMALIRHIVRGELGEVLTMIVETQGGPSRIGGMSKEMYESSSSSVGADVDSSSRSVGLTVNTDKTLSHSPLIQACSCRRYGVMLLLLTRGESVDVLTMIVETQGGPSRIGGMSKEMYESSSSSVGADVDSSSRSVGLTVNTDKTISHSPLIQACSCRRYGVMLLLLTRGESVDVRNSDGNTCLHLCCQNGDVRGIEVLLRHGVSIQIINNLKQTPLHMCSDVNVLEMILTNSPHPLQLLFSKDCHGYTPVHEYCRKGQEQCVRLCIKQCLKDVDDPKERVKQIHDFLELRDNSGYTPLHHAAMNGHDLVIGILLLMGVDVNARGNDGRTPLHLAVLHSHQKATKTLLGFGARRDILSSKNRTPLHLALSVGAVSCIEHLLRYSPVIYNLEYVAAAQRKKSDERRVMSIVDCMEVFSKICDICESEGMGWKNGGRTWCRGNWSLEQTMPIGSDSQYGVTGVSVPVERFPMSEFVCELHNSERLIKAIFLERFKEAKNRLEKEEKLKEEKEKLKGVAASPENIEVSKAEEEEQEMKIEVELTEEQKKEHSKLCGLILRPSLLPLY